MSRAIANSIASRLREAGHQALFAGGCVRDRLLGKEPKDHDIATSALPEQVLALFPGGNQVGAHFGVILVREKGCTVEVASFRTDGSYGDGRRPDRVMFSTPEEDARRRDFTINGLFEIPESGEIIDHVGGLADLRAGVLRAIGEPRERFTEDSLRLLRAVRFHCALGFALEPTTARALADCSPLLARIAPERIRDEFSRILTGPRRGQALDLLMHSGLMRHIIPEVLTLVGCEQPPEWHPEGDVYTHTRIMLDMLEPEAALELCLSVLLHDIGKPPTFQIEESTGRIRFSGHDAVGAGMAEAILRRLRYPNDTIHAVTSMVARHMQFMNVKQMRMATLKRFLSTPEFEMEMELHRVDCGSSNGLTDNYDYVREKQREFAAEPLIPPPLVTGRDLIRLGLNPGPRFGVLLETLQNEQLENRLTDRTAALARLEELLAAEEI